LKTTGENGILSQEWIVSLCSECHVATGNQESLIKMPIAPDGTDQSTLDEYIDDDLKKKEKELVAVSQPTAASNSTTLLARLHRLAANDK